MHCFKKTNDLFERFNLRQRHREPIESFDQFAAALRDIICKCNCCKSCEESLLQDQFTYGIQNDEQTKKHKQTMDLTLENCVDICRRTKLVHKPHCQVRSTVARKLIEDCSICERRYALLRLQSYNRTVKYLEENKQLAFEQSR